MISLPPVDLRTRRPAELVGPRGRTKERLFPSSRRSRFVDDRHAVSDVIGSILLVSITVLVATALVLVVLKELVPNKAIHADLQLSVKSGDGVWTNGNEKVVVEHRGGEALKQEATTIRVLHDGAVHTFEGSSLGFSDGRLDLGESWSHDFTISEGNEVGVDVIGIPGSGGSLMLATNVLTVPMPEATTSPPSPSDPFRYAASYTAVRGTMDDFSRLQSATAAEATVTEAAPPPATVSLSANAAASSSGWSNSGNGFASGGGDATNAANNPAILQYRHADVTGNPGTITNVVLKVQASVTPSVDDGFTLSACIAATCTTASGVQGTSASTVLMTWDVTNLNPATGAWTWAHVNSLEDKITPTKVGGRDGTWRVDWAYVDVTYTVPQNALNMQIDFTGVQPDPTHVLQLKYRVTGDTFSVEVYDFSSNAWNTRGATLNSASSTQWTVTLIETGSVDEFNGGAPRIRLIDATPLGSTPGQIFLDYARVTQ